MCIGYHVVTQALGKMFELVTAYLLLQGYTTLRPGGKSVRFARFGDRSVIAIEAGADGRFSVRSERLGTPCLVLRSHCVAPSLLAAIVEQVCVLDQLGC